MECETADTRARGVQRQQRKDCAVDDIIIAPDKSVTYAIIGAGGFLGVARHNVAIRVSQLKADGDKLVLPGATKEALKQAPEFEYAR
jgi:hypothetical protein